MITRITENLRRSPFFYVGDKFKLIPQLKEHFPKEIDRFIEPFCGGGSVSLNVDANNYILNDIDSYIIKLHKFLLSYSDNQDDFWDKIIFYIDKYNLSATFIGKDVPKKFRKEYVKTYFAKYNKNSYIKMRTDFNKDKNNLMLLYMLLIYGFNRMIRFNLSGNFNLPVGNVDFNSNVVNALNDYFDYVYDKNIDFYNLDFQEFIKQINPTTNDFIYLDPPYLITYSEYNKLWNINSEKRLINFIDELNENNIRFAVSNIILHKNRYNKIFYEWSKKYNVVEIKSNYISYHDNTDKNSLEVLVKNY